MRRGISDKEGRRQNVINGHGRFYGERDKPGNEGDDKRKGV